MDKRLLLFVSTIGAIVVLGLIFNGRFNGNESPTPVIQNQSLSPLETLISNEGGVEVAVTPVNIPDSSKWAFEINLTTHSVELSEDMVQVSKLVLDSNEVINPSGWEGDPPGGHHRNGTLTFNAPAKLPSSATLKILGVGGVPEREFQWSLK